METRAYSLTEKLLSYTQLSEVPTPPRRTILSFLYQLFVNIFSLFINENKMYKDFDTWNIEKKLTERTSKEINFYEREVWWYIAGLNIGVEIDGKHEFFLRPCVVVRKFNKDMLLVVPTTTQEKTNKYYLKISGTESKTYNVCLSQIRTISSKRLFRKIDTINTKDYQLLLNKISDMIKGYL